MTCAMALPESAGTCGMTFLKIDFSPRTSSMGGASAGFAGGPDGLLGNPASMSFEKKAAVGTGFGLYYAGISGGYIVAQRDFGFGKLGLSTRFLIYGKMDRTDDLGNITGEFGSTDLAISVAYSREIFDDLSVGIAPFFASSSIDTFGAAAIGADIGVLYKFDHGKGRAGMSIRNIGVQLSGFVESKDTLPAIIAAGASYRLTGLPVCVLAQGDYSLDAGFSGGFGLELIELKPLYIRAGYRIRPRVSGELAEGETWNGITAGFGLHYKDIWTDYAFQHYGVLGMTHRFAISYDGF